MAKQPFFPREFESQLVWFINFDDNIATYATKYGITLAQQEAQEADREWLNHWWTAHTQTKTYSQGLTAFKNEVAYGLPEGELPSVPPVPPTVGVAPAAVLPGVYKRALAIANAIKVHKDYTIADGEVLGLEGAEITLPDLANARPVLKPKAAADHVDIGWGKQALPVDGIELWMKRGAAAFAFLAVDTTTPKYVDTHPFPATEEEWVYKAIYIADGGRIGLWSEEVKVRVKA